MTKSVERVQSEWYQNDSLIAIWYICFVESVCARKPYWKRVSQEIACQKMKIQKKRSVYALRQSLDWQSKHAGMSKNLIKNLWDKNSRLECGSLFGFNKKSFEEKEIKNVCIVVDFLQSKRRRRRFRPEDRPQRDQRLFRLVVSIQHSERDFPSII